MLSSLKPILQGAGLAAAVPYTGPPKNLLKWFDKEIAKRVQIVGTRTLGYHHHEVEGDQQAFETLNYSGFGGRRFTDIGAISMTGRNVAGLFNFNSTIVNNRFEDPQAERSSIDYDRRPFTINIGDINGTLLNTNRFASFSKRLSGAQARYLSGRFAIKGVMSESRGSARTISFQGTNSAGPYYLQSSQIVRGSEEIQVDGQPMQIGRDYVINYEAGSITFVSRIIPPTSTIVASYEALGFNAGFGKVTGVSMKYDMGKAGSIGLTSMNQKTGSGSALSQRVELFQGAGAPSTPYYLSLEPLQTRPITVKLDGIPQVPGVDYRFDTANPVIFYFLRFVPLTSTIEVVYTPRPTTTVNGDRNVVGFDYHLPIGRRGAINYYQATGEQTGDVNPLKGTARGLDANYRVGEYDFRAGVRQIPSGYVSVETRGLSRNEDAFDWGANYKGKKLDVSLAGLNSVVSLRQVDGDGDVFFRRARASNFSAAARYRPEVGTIWDLEHTRSASLNLGRETELNRTSLTTGRTFGRLILRGGLEFQDGRGPVADSTGTSTTMQDVDLRSYILEGSYTAGEDWAFRGKLGLSDIKTTEKSGAGQDYSLSVSYTPSEKFSTSATYALSNSGALATLGAFDTGTGLGYGGNGFSGGTTGSVFSGGAADARLFQINSVLNLSDRLNLIGTFSDSRSAGAISSNSESQGYSLSLEWDMGAGHRLGASLSQTRTRFLSGTSNIDTTTLNVDYAATPKGRLSWRLGGSLFLSGGNSLYGQDSAFFDGSVSYNLAPRQALSLAANFGRTTGYLPQNEHSLSLAYSYQIYRNIALVAAYRIRDVRNQFGTDTTGAYRSRGFDIDLTFNFIP